MRKPKPKHNPDTGVRIRELRLASNMTRWAFAQKVGYTERAVQYWEEGQRAVPADLLPKLVKIFGITHDKFWEGVEGGEEK